MLSRLMNRHIQAGPAYAKKSFFGSELQAFHLRLRQALPNCCIFPDVALSSLMAPTAYTDIAPPKFEAAPPSVLRFDAKAAPVSAPVLPRHQSNVSSLTVQDLIGLTPQGHVKAAYPHIWERICLFCTEPRHLEQYLSSLSLQDRGGKRAGFPEGVIAELAELQGANARFIPTQTQVRASWNDVFFDR